MSLEEGLIYAMLTICPILSSSALLMQVDIIMKKSAKRAQKPILILTFQAITFVLEFSLRRVSR